MSASERIESVWYGQDYELVPLLIRYYCRVQDPRILDATWGGGRFWKKNEGLWRLNVIGLDINPEKKPDVVGDNMNMPFADKSFDVIMYDPPHLTDQATSSGRERFIDLWGDGGYHPNVNHLFTPFLKEANRVLKFPGLLICKMIDMVNRRKQELQHIDLILMAREQGFTVDDLIIKVRKNPLKSGVWQNNLHARKAHSYFIICRRGRSRSTILQGGQENNER